MWKQQGCGTLKGMRPHKRIGQLTPDEYQALRAGTKSPSGFTTRRSHMLLLSAEGLSPPQIAQRLLCGEQTVRNALRAFEAEGRACLQPKSNRAHHDSSAFDQAALQHLGELVQRSPREFGVPSSLWTLKLLAQVCMQLELIAQRVSYETVRKALLKLGIDWQSARQRITSHEPHDAPKKTTCAFNHLGTTAPTAGAAVMGR